MVVGEDPLTCAQRELREETGYEAAQWQALGHFVLDPNRSNSQAYFYLARGLTPVGDLELDAGEDITVHVMPADKLFNALAQGEMVSLACAAAWGVAAPFVLAKGG
jgi:ADP-ribose pyrophosphatase